MFLSYPRMDWQKHKQELLIMLVPRFGTKKLIAQSVIFGRWVVYYTS